MKTNPSNARKTSRRILTGSIAAILAGSLVGSSAVHAQTTIGSGTTLSVNDPADKYLSTSGGYLGTITIMDDATLKTEPGSQAHFTIENNLVFGGAGGIRHLEFNNNDTIFTFTGAITSTGTGAQTLAIVTGVNGNGDREEVTFNNGIPNVGDGSNLALDVTFNTQSPSYSFVNLVGVNGFQGNITLHKGANVAAGYLTIGGRGIGDNGNQYQSVSGSGNLGNGNFAGNISIDDSTILDYNSSSAQILSGVISNGANGAGQLVKEASGTLTLTGVSTFTGASFISGGTLAVGGAGQLGSGTYAGAVTTSNGATFSYNSTADQVLSGVFSGDGLIVKDNTGILTLSGANSGSGTTTVNGGVLRLSHASALSSGLLTVSGGVVELASGNLQRNPGGGGGEVQVGAGSSGFSARGAARTVTIGTTNDSLTWGSGDFAPGTLVLNATTANSKLTFANGLDFDGAARTIEVGADTAEITGAITGGAGSDLNKTGNGILILSGAHTHNGATTVTGGELAVGGTLTGGLTVNTGTTIRPLVGGSLTTPALTFDDASYRWLIGSATNSNTLNSHIQVNGNVSITGAPVLKVDSLGAAANGATTYEILKYTGTLSGGQPAWTVDLSLVNSSPIKSWADGNGNWDTAVNWAGGGFSGGQVQYDNANSRLVLVNLSSSPGVPVSTSDVVIDKVGGANVTGSAVATTINSLGLGNGTDPISLTVQGGGPLTVTAATTINHATLTANDTFATTSMTSSGTSTVNGSGSVGTVGSPLSTFSVASGTTSFGGTVTVHTGGLNVNGTASLNTGSTIVTPGVTGGGTVNFNGGTLKASGSFTLAAGAGNIAPGGAVIDANGQTVTVDQVWTHDVGDGGLTAKGGSVIIKQAQTYTGATRVINGATLKIEGVVSGLYEGLVSNSNGADSSSSVPHTSIQASARWADATGTGGSNVFPNWADNTTFGYQGFFYNPSNSPVTYKFGKDFDDFGLIRIDGNDVINDNNWGDAPTADYSLTPGWHAVDLRVGQGGGGAGPVNGGFGGGHGLAYSTDGGSTWIGFAEVAANAGRFAVQFAGTNLLPVTTAMSIASGSTLDFSGSQQELASLADDGGGGGLVTNSGTEDVTLTLSGAGTTSFGGVISDGATKKVSLVKSGSGTQTLSGVNTYTGSTTVSNGTLAIGTGGSLASPTITVSGTGVLDTTLASLTLGAGSLLTNDNSVNGTVIAGNGSTVRGSGTFAGELTVNGGGVIKPGSDGSGTMTITGATGLTLQTGSAINWFLNASSTGGEINITGSPVIAANVAFSPSVDPGATVAPSYTFMTWTGADPAHTPVFQATAPAGTVNWTNNGDQTTWDDAPNWDLQVWSGTIAKVAKTFTINGLTQIASAPVASSSVVIDGYNVTGPASAKTVANLTVQGGSTVSLQSAPAGLTVSTLTEVKAGSILNVAGPLNSKQVSVVNGSTVDVSSTGTIATERITLATNASLNLGGGTLKATAANPDFLTGSTGTSVNVRDGGGAVIDSNGFDITVKMALQHDNSVAQDDGLTKTGAGILTLTKPQTYNGATNITGGVLKLQGGGFGGLVTPIAVTAQSYYGGDDRAPGHAIDGTGMTPNTPAVTLASTANNGPGGEMWLSDNIQQTWITFDLGSSQTLSGFHLWNYNENSGDPDFHTGRGVKTAGIYVGNSLLANGSDYATQAGSNWGTLVQNFTFNQADGTTADAGSNYAFTSSVTGRYIQIYVTGNFGNADNYTGISEIRFLDAANPNNYLPVKTPVTMSSGTTLNLNNGSQQVASLADVDPTPGNTTGHTVVLGGATLTIGDPTSLSTAETIFSGDITSTALDGSAVEKVGPSVQTLNGAQTYDSLTVTAGTLNVNGELGTTPANGTATVVVADNATLKFGSVSQTLSSLSIGASSTVVFTSGIASGAFSGSGKIASLSSGSAVVPEPGSLSLLVGGALGFLGRRRRQNRA
ncbi:MAG: autotransporter-associated beta strand repeat-containing protein [Chthoniobacter sp.]|nr:autotransporter-associated beta strand repeat-containing protein [Chthoniobacter sp.]